MSPPPLPKPVKRDVPFVSDSEIEEFVRQFEIGRWPYEHWTHRAHLALGAWALRRWAFDDAVIYVRQAIQRYNRTTGDPNGYHETLTLFFMRKIHAFLNNWPADASVWEAVSRLAAICGKDAMSAHYSPERLWSAEARRTWLEPDLKPWVGSEESAERKSDRPLD